MSEDLRTVTEIRSGGRGSKRRFIWMDGEPWRSMAAEVVRELAICEGDALDTAAISAQALAIEYRLARERALRLLAYRERSEAEVARRLTDDGYPEEVVLSTVSALTDTGLLDDRRFAAIYARSLVQLRGLGRVRAMRDMVGRGLDKELAAEALDAIAPPERESDRALEAAVRAIRPGDSPDRLAGRLVRRGFSTGQALAAAHRAVSDAADSDEMDTP